MKINRNVTKQVTHNVNFLVCDSCASEVELTAHTPHFPGWASISVYTKGEQYMVQKHYCPSCVAGLKGIS